MTTIEYFNEFINPVCHKTTHGTVEFNKLKENEMVVRVKATTLYQLYKHNVFGKNDDRLTLQEFYKVSSQYLYYDKLVCEHGTEFYYYVVFNEDNDMYRITKKIVDVRVYNNRPDTLEDLMYTIEAVSKQPIKENR